MSLYQKWHCVQCSTTESVWACLSCPYVACGRFLEEHALKHYTESKHPLAIEVNEKYVYCYECDEYVLNDNPSGDIKILRNCLRAITTQQFSGVRGKSKRLLRSASYHSNFGGSYEKLHEEDRCYTALWFRRYYLLAKAFTAWRSQVKAEGSDTEGKKPAPASPASPLTPGKRPRGRPRKHPRSASSAPARPALPRALSTPAQGTRGPQRRTRALLIPGVTGLRNLGNTCYMNSILQVLRHVQVFRKLFLALEEAHDTAMQGAYMGDRLPSPEGPRKFASLKHLDSRGQVRGSGKTAAGKSVTGKTAAGKSVTGGLNGGGSSSKHVTRVGNKATPDHDKISLCHELHALLRVMWSGKWALVSPHKMLYAVWNLIPFFKGYSQQDAQEFLCEFLDRVQNELERMKNVTEAKASSHMSALMGSSRDVVGQMFQGQLVSEVTCLKCRNKSRTREPFMDLSLEFPDRYHPNLNKPSKVCVEGCHIYEMLSKFTEAEKLDGKIYACELCNNKRRKVASRPTIYTEVEKRFMVSQLPQVLRFHLKRFMWGGRNHRGKITVPVKFDEEIDMHQFCHSEVAQTKFVYQLAAVVMHHGRGFGSGHYTAYCWNDEASSWVHCNDAKMAMCSLEEVQRSQAYILIYTLKGMRVSDSQLLTSLEETNSAIPKFQSLKRKLSEDSRGRMELKRRKSNIW